MVHVDEGFPVHIGDGVTVGHSAIIHGCTIGDNTLIGMGATVLNGAKIGKGCLIGANALVTQGMEIPDYSLVVGMPAVIKRTLTPEEVKENQKNAQVYVEEAKKHSIPR
jgi:carbonic anhydrase/acetyltransferase-like protein (isoleucine patch superfamily)